MQHCYGGTGKERNLLFTINHEHHAGLLLSTAKFMLKALFAKEAVSRWLKGIMCIVTKRLLDMNKSKHPILLDRLCIGIATGIITGHCLTKLHSNNFCRRCRDEMEEEFIEHCLCHCVSSLDTFPTASPRYHNRPKTAW